MNRRTFFTRTVVALGAASLAPFAAPTLKAGPQYVRLQGRDGLRRVRIFMLTPFVETWDGTRRWVCSHVDWLSGEAVYVDA